MVYKFTSLHLPQKRAIHVGKYTSPMDGMGHSMSWLGAHWDLFSVELLSKSPKEDIQDAKNRRSYAFGGDEVWPFFCGYGHAKVRHVPTTACYPRLIGYG